MLSRLRKNQDRLRDADPKVRRQAAEGLSPQKAIELESTLATLAADDVDADVRAACIERLTKPELLAPLLDGDSGQKAAQRIAVLAGEIAADDVALGDTGDDGDPPLVEEEPPDPPMLRDGVWYTSFDYLGSFDSGIMALGEDSIWAHESEAAPDTGGEKGIPKVVKALDQQIVEIEGYMIPLKFEKGNVRTFYLSRYMMSCCFGLLPKANEVIEVEMMTKDGALYDAYMPIVVKGLFEVHEEGAESEYLKTVFTMKGEEYRFSDDW